MVFIHLKMRESEREGGGTKRLVKNACIIVVLGGGGGHILYREKLFLLLFVFCRVVVSGMFSVYPELILAWDAGDESERERERAHFFVFCVFFFNS